MNRIDFYISNNNHHWQIIKPVIQELLNTNQRIRLMSFCELRRMPTPVDVPQGVDMVRLFDRKVRGMGTSFGNRGLGGNRSPLRNMLRFILWQFILKPRVVKLIRNGKPAISVLPNDTAFPFNYLCKELKRYSIRFLLIQEGIRFPLPNEKGGIPYGSNGAVAVLAWGEKSASYFRNMGCNVEVVGCPRYDQMLKQDYSSEIQHLESRYQFGQYNILFASNPVDDQGFCSRLQKLDLFKKFLLSAELLFPPNHRIFLKLHPRESAADFSLVIKDTAMEQKVSIVDDVPLFLLLRKVNLVVIFASTIGLEAALNGTQVCVVKLPGYGFQFDYVDSGIALPLDLDRISEFKLKSISRQAMEEYSRGYLAYQGQSAKRVATVIMKYIR